MMSGSRCVWGLWLVGFLLSSCGPKDLGGGRYATPMYQVCDGQVVVEEGLQPLHPTVQLRNCVPAPGVMEAHP